MSIGARWQPAHLHHPSQTHTCPAVSRSNGGFQLRTHTEPVAIVSRRRAAPRAPLRAHLTARRIGARTRSMAACTPPSLLSNSHSPRGEPFRWRLPAPHPHRARGHRITVHTGARRHERRCERIWLRSYQFLSEYLWMRTCY